MAAGSHNGVMTQAAVPPLDATPPLCSAEFQRNPYPTYRRCLEDPALRPMVGRDGVWLLFGCWVPNFGLRGLKSLRVDT